MFESLAKIIITLAFYGLIIAALIKYISQ